MRTTHPGRYLGSALVLLAACLFAWPGAGSALSLSRFNLFSGEVWRFFTGHLVHWSIDQLVWDGLAVLVLWPFCWDRTPKRTVLAIFLAACLIPPVVIFGAPDCIEYRGLSGLASALFVLALGTLRNQHALPENTNSVRIVDCLFLGFLAKMGWEAATGGTVFADLNGALSVPLSHAAGAVAGAIGWASYSLAPDPSSPASIP